MPAMVKVKRKITQLKNIEHLLHYLGQIHIFLEKLLFFTAELCLKSVTHEMRSFLSSQKISVKNYKSSILHLRI